MRMDEQQDTVWVWALGGPLLVAVAVLAAIVFAEHLKADLADDDSRDARSATALVLHACGPTVTGAACSSP